jgi:hypothetical protein
MLRPAIGCRLDCRARPAIAAAMTHIRRESSTDKSQTGTRTTLRAQFRERPPRGSIMVSGSYLYPLSLPPTSSTIG